MNFVRCPLFQDVKDISHGCLLLEQKYHRSVINTFLTGSPLHGILAGVELLQDSQLTPFQEEMSLSVALAGRTLLDTVNHILDYSKISNLTRDQKKERARVDAARHKSAHVEDGDKSFLTVVDLARITEDVVETVVSASRFSSHSIATVIGRALNRMRHRMEIPCQSFSTSNKGTAGPPP